MTRFISRNKKKKQRNRPRLAFLTEHEDGAVSESYYPYEPMYVIDARGKYLDVNQLPPSPKLSREDRRRIKMKDSRTKRIWEPYTWTDYCPDYEELEDIEIRRRHKEELCEQFAKLYIEQYINGIEFVEFVHSVLRKGICSVRVGAVYTNRNDKPDAPYPMYKEIDGYRLILSLWTFDKGLADFEITVEKASKDKPLWIKLMEIE